MTDIIEIKVPDITPSSMGEFIIEIYGSDKKPVKNAEFNYSVDTGQSRTDKTDENGVLRVKVKSPPPPQNISLSRTA